MRALVLLTALIFLAGCAEKYVGPVDPIVEGDAIVSMSVFLQKTGKIGEKRGSYKPTILLYKFSTVEKYDTIAITGDTIMLPTLKVEKGFSYELVFHAMNPGAPFFTETHGGRVSFTADKDTIPLAVNLKTYIAELSIPVILKGSPAYSIAKSVKCVWGIDALSFWKDSVVINFTPESRDTVKISGLTKTEYSTLITLRIDNSDGSYYLGSVSTPVITPSTSYNLEITLTKYVGNDVVSGVIFLGKVETITIKVNFGN